MSGGPIVPVANLVGLALKVVMVDGLTMMPAQEELDDNSRRRCKKNKSLCS